MTRLARTFIITTLGLVALYLLFAHYTGAEGIANAIGGNYAGIIKVLQGR